MTGAAKLPRLRRPRLGGKPLPTSRIGPKPPPGQPDFDRDPAVILLRAEGLREVLRTGTESQRLRAAVAILKLEMARMRGEWSPDDPCAWDDMAEGEHLKPCWEPNTQPPNPPPFSHHATPFGQPKPSRPKFAENEPRPELEPQFCQTRFVPLGWPTPAGSRSSSLPEGTIGFREGEAPAEPPNTHASRPEPRPPKPPPPPGPRPPEVRLAGRRGRRYSPAGLSDSYRVRHTPAGGLGMGRLSVRSWLAVLVLTCAGGRGLAQRPDPPLLPPLPAPSPAAPAPRSLPTPAAEPSDRVLPINLATALELANARPLDIQIAARQVAIAARQLDRAKLAWVPNIVTGLDYFRHEGGQQNFAGEIVKSSRGSLAVGVGPNVVFNLSDAIHGPLAAKQDLRARRAFQQAAANDTAFAVAEAYFTVQQARGELAGAVLALDKADEVSRKAEKLAEGLAPPLEASRARVELARRQQAATTARERWRLASAELVRLLRLEPGTLVEPLEPPLLTVPVIDPNATLDALIPVGLTSRPELAAHQAVVQAALARLKQERLRPLVPSIALRSTATNPSGSVAWAGFGGGPNGSFGGFGSRFDLDLQVMWEFQSLGFGNRARVGERKAEQEVAVLELFRVQDRVAAEVTAAFAQVKAATDRLAQSEPALTDAQELVDKSLRGMSQTRRVGETLVLVVRTQEVVAAVQALGQANADYCGAVGDYNRAQFRLFRALGHPSHGLAGAVPKFGTVSVSDPLPPPITAAAPAVQPPRTVSVHAKPAAGPVVPASRTVPRGAMPAVQPDLPDPTALRDLPLTRYILARPPGRPTHHELAQTSGQGWQTITPTAAPPPASTPPPIPPPKDDGIRWEPIRPAAPEVTPPLRWPFR